jgi:hypothetical protein
MHRKYSGQAGDIWVRSVTRVNNIELEFTAEGCTVPEAHHEVTSVRTRIRPIIKILCVERKVVDHIGVHVTQVKNNISYDFVYHDQVICELFLLCHATSVSCLSLDSEDLFGSVQARE